MSNEKIEKMISEFEKIPKPDSPKNPILDDIWDDIMLYLSDFLVWKGKYIEHALKLSDLDLQDGINHNLNIFRPETERDKQDMQNLINFKAAIDRIVREIKKELE